MRRALPKARRCASWTSRSCPFRRSVSPLSSKRKSGFLTPIIGLGNVNGVEVSQPYYLNLAPNRDATVWGTLMSKRGVDLAGEFRYLEAPYQGLIWGNYMPWDRLRDEKRWGFAAVHSGTLPGGMGLNLNLNRVSDDNYWKDFTRVSTSLTTRLLPSDANLTWSQGGFSAAARALYWQTLQDSSAPITPPYNRMPQLTARYGGSAAAGFDYSVNADYTKFESVPSLTGQPNGQRAFVAAQVSRPWIQPGAFVTPKLMLQATNYAFDGNLSNGDARANVTVPTVSLDSGLIFERDTSYFGRDLRQTLEPRAPSMSIRRIATRTTCRITTRPASTTTSPPSTRKTPMPATTASPTTTC
jgi:LPS-assembly protein